jgi:hypothetical protein
MPFPNVPSDVEEDLENLSPEALRAIMRGTHSPEEITRLSEGRGINAIPHGMMAFYVSWRICLESFIRADGECHSEGCILYHVRRNE